MRSSELKRQARFKRKKRIRKKVFGTSQRPRLSVFRSANHIYAQIIDDVSGYTIVAASSLEKNVKDHPMPAAPEGDEQLSGKIAKAAYIGKLVAERAVEKGVKKVVFDRNGFLYHGRVKAVSVGARKGGLDF
ncbi:MAG: 50S ribosomal protein L18 [Desulfobacteraceae bacterium]|nr:50S ribosomal protein L18 [Desulfobacteraceae bacterium]